MEFGSQHIKASMFKTFASHFFTFQGVDAKCLVAQLTPPGVSNRGIQGSNSPPPTIKLKNKSKMWTPLETLGGAFYPIRLLASVLPVSIDGALRADSSFSEDCLLAIRQ